MKNVRFIGTSLADLRAFPQDVRRNAGMQIDRVQRGLMPTDWKLIPAIGPGVVEIRLRSVAGAFRVVYVASRGPEVVVLHCFQKKVQQIAHRDIALAAARYRVFFKGVGDE